MSTIPAGRRQYILTAIGKTGTVTVSELSGKLGVSELTIRRDLDLLAGKGMVERTHGGAVARKNLLVEPDYLQKASEYRNEKRAIGAMVASLVDEGDTLYVNSGSTTFEAVRAIVDLGRNVTIVTNNIDAAWLCKREGSVRLILAGGVYRPRSHSVSGSLSSSVIEGIYANKAIIGVDGFSLSAGLSTPVLEEAETTRSMIEHTVGKVIVAASGNKIGVVSNFRTVSLDRVDILVTDRTGGRILEQTEIREGLRVLIADESR
jgi:DeoR/GlpR family transcriptional regulator of sugar metabolism